MHLSQLQGCGRRHGAHPDATDKTYRAGKCLSHFLAQGVTDDLRQIMSAKITGLNRIYRDQRGSHRGSKSNSCQNHGCHGLGEKRRVGVGASGEVGGIQAEKHLRWERFVEVKMQMIISHPEDVMKYV